MGFKDMTELQRRQHHADETRVEELQRYAADRSAAIAAIELTGATTMSLDLAARLLPEHPEWSAPRRRTRR